MIEDGRERRAAALWQIKEVPRALPRAIYNIGPLVCALGRLRVSRDPDASAVGDAWRGIQESPATAKSNSRRRGIRLEVLRRLRAALSSTRARSPFEGSGCAGFL